MAAEEGDEPRFLRARRFVTDWYRARSPRAKIGAAIGVLVWLLSFWAVSLMWLLGNWEPGLPGAFAFKSFAVGDGLILPLAAAVLFAAGRWDQGFRGWRRWSLVVAGLLGLTAGATLQALWLADPDIAPNWSIPRPHHFTYSGWYHAVSLTVLTTLFAVLGVAAAIRWWEDHRRPVATELDGPLLTRVGGFVLLSSFSSLWLIDTSTIRDPLGELAVAVLVVPLLTLAVLIGTARGERKGVLQVSGLMILGVVALMLVAVAGVPTTAEYGLVTIAFGLFTMNLVVGLWNARRDPAAATDTPVDEDMERLGFLIVVHVLAAFVGAAIPLYILERYHPAKTDVKGMSVSECLAMTSIGLTAGLVIVTLAAGLLGVSLLTRRYLVPVAVTAALYVALVGFGAMTGAGDVGGYYEAFVLVWSTSIIVALFYAKKLMRVQVEAENRGEMAEDRTEGEWPHPAKAMTYVWSVSALVSGAFLYLAKLVMESGKTKIVRVPPSVDMALVPVVLVVLVLVCIAIAETRLRAHRGLLLVVLVVGGALLVAASVTTLPWPQIAASGLGRGWVSSAVILFPLLGLVSFIVEGILGNAFLLRGRRIQSIDAVLAVAAGLVVAAGLASGLLAVVFVTGIFGALILVATYGAVLALPRVAVYAWMTDNLRETDMRTNSSAGIIQDTFLSTLLCLFVMGIPFYSVMSNENVPGAIIQSMAFLSAIGAIYGWSVSLNFEHSKSYAADVRSGEWPPKDGTWHHLTAETAPAALHGHIKRQGFISAVMLVPVIPFVFSQLDVEGVLPGG